MRKRRHHKPLNSGLWTLVMATAVLAATFAIISRLMPVNVHRSQESIPTSKKKVARSMRENTLDVRKTVARDTTHLEPGQTAWGVQRQPTSPQLEDKPTQLSAVTPPLPKRNGRSPETMKDDLELFIESNKNTPPKQRLGIGALTFAEWRKELWKDAQKAGISRKSFDMLLSNMKPDLSLPDLVIPGRPTSKVRGQAEFIKTPAGYIDEKSIQRLARQGRAKLKKHAKLLAEIEKRFGVSRYVVLAIWGRESAFGKYRLPHNAIRALATQAYAGRRKELFRKELIIALSLVDRGIVNPAKLHASWAGAMGPTQFMPSDYDKYAVSFNGRGQPDPWESLPDALASAANQLRKNGWIAGEPWGYEVRMPNAVDCTFATPSHQKSLSEWNELNVLPIAKLSVHANQTTKGSLLMPAGNYGPAFLTTQNFQAIKAYNLSELYALFVAHLSDRIAGGGPFSKPWRKVALLRTGEVEEIQQHLLDRELYLDKVDGKAGSRTRAAVGVYQRSNDLRTDCWPTKTTLAHIRKSVNPSNKN